MVNIKRFYSHFYVASSDTDVFCDDDVVGFDGRHHGRSSALVEMIIQCLVT